jgi:lipopolysaccharide export system protein LptA
MKIRNPRSILIIVFYVLVNGFIIASAFRLKKEEAQKSTTAATLAPEFTEIENLDYFHLKESIPQLSLSAQKMRSQAEELAEFDFPKGLYNYREKNQTLRYQAEFGRYKKSKDVLLLERKVRVVSDEEEYLADRVKYFFKKDLILGSGGVTFKGQDPKSKDALEVHADRMRANPNNQFSRFKGNVHGSMQRKKKYEGKTTFSAQQLELKGLESLAHLEGDVRMQRQTYTITAGKADIYLENYNKSLKYFVLNDDVKVTETMQTPEGTVQRKAFSERLEGFGREQKMVLSGAPKVEQGTDVVKGYRITIRENMDLIEVDDAMSDVQVKREEDKKKAQN